MFVSFFTVAKHFFKTHTTFTCCSSSSLSTTPTNFSVTKKNTHKMMMDHHVTKQKRTTNYSRKSKHGNDQTQNKKKKIPQRGMGIAHLEEKRILKECLENMTEIPPSLHHPSQNGVVVQFPHHHHRRHYQQQQQLPLASAGQQMMYPGMYGSPANVFMDNVVVHPNANPGYRFDNRNEMSYSVPNYVKCGASDHAACGTCYSKKKRINMSGSNNNLNTPNQFRYGMNNVIGKIDYTAKNLCFSPQVREGRLGYRVWTGGNNGISEYEFFPEKGGETTSSWCVSGGGGTETRGMMIGSHGGEGSSCVTSAVTSNEEGSVCCSVDLSLKL